MGGKGLHRAGGGERRQEGGERALDCIARVGSGGAVLQVEVKHRRVGGVEGAVQGGNGFRGGEGDGHTPRRSRRAPVPVRPHLRQGGCPLHELPDGPRQLRGPAAPLEARGDCRRVVGPRGGRAPRSRDVHHRPRLPAAGRRAGRSRVHPALPARIASIALSHRPMWARIAPRRRYVHTAISATRRGGAGRWSLPRAPGSPPAAGSAPPCRRGGSRCPRGQAAAHAGYARR